MFIKFQFFVNSKYSFRNENEPDEVECSRCGGSGSMRKVTFKKRKE